MNLGIVAIGLLSSRIRTGIHLGGVVDFDGFGIIGVFWFCVFINVLMLVLLLFFFTPKMERGGIGGGFDLYNYRRPHSSLGDRTPMEVYHPKVAA